MITFVDFFRPASLRIAALRYAIICVIRIILGFSLGSDRPIIAYLHPFNIREIINFTHSIYFLYVPLGSLVNFALLMAQAVLLWRMFRLIGKDPEEIKVDYKKAGSWLATPLMLSLVVIVTCCLIGWIVQTGGTIEDLLTYLVYGSGTPVAVGVVLSLLGSLFGGRFVAGAKASIGHMFGINYLSEDHPLSQRVARHAETLGLPAAPAVGIVDVLNAFAIGTPKDSTVVLGQPLLDILTDEELDAVIGHELGHIYHNDMNRMQFAEGFQRMLGNVISATTVILVSALSRNRSDAMLGRAAGLALRQTVFVGSELVVKGISRAREFHADAVGARIASPAAMIGALERLHGLPSQPTKLETQYGYLMFRGSRIGAWFSTHPHVEKRIKALSMLDQQPEAEAVSEAVIHPKLDAIAGTAATKLGSALGTAKTGLANASTSFDFDERKRAALASTSNFFGKIPALRLSARTAVLAIAGLGVLALATPAIYSYYGLEEQTDSLKASVAGTYSAVGTSLSGVADNAIASLTTYDEQLADKDAQLKSQQTQIDTQKREISRQENLVVSLRRQLAEATKPPVIAYPAEPVAETDKSLKAKVDEQRLRIFSLEQDLASYKAVLAKLREGQAETPVATASFGAFAASEDGIVFLTENGFTSESEAQRAAMAGCLQFSRDKSCSVRRSFSGTCAAIARVTPGNRSSSWQLAFGETATGAENNALTTCFGHFNKRCMVTVPGVCIRN